MTASPTSRRCRAARPARPALRVARRSRAWSAHGCAVAGRVVLLLIVLFPLPVAGAAGASGRPTTSSTTPAVHADARGLRERCCRAISSSSFGNSLPVSTLSTGAVAADRRARRLCADALALQGRAPGGAVDPGDAHGAADRLHHPVLPGLPLARPAGHDARAWRSST